MSENKRYKSGRGSIIQKIRPRTPGLGKTLVFSINERSNRLEGGEVAVGVASKLALLALHTIGGSSARRGLITARNASTLGLLKQLAGSV